ncbi:MAG: photosynthetic complex putative assembly protein PuhB [Pseudomonadota bacterium]
MNYIHNHDDYATEPVRGLPAALPRGEFVLWQGAPSWRAFARQVFYTHIITALVVAGAIARAALSLNAGASVGTAAGEAGIILAFGLVGVGILMLLAWLVERTTVYTITNKRVMMRVGVAIQKTFNVPFAAIDGAALRSNNKDIGNLSVSLKPDVSLAYLILWPHVRPWRMRNTEPTLRAIPKASNVAKLLTDTYTAYVQTHDALQRSGVKVENLNAGEPQTAGTETLASDDAGGQEKLKDPHYIPRSLVIMAASAVVITVLVVAFAQWTDTSALRTNDGAPAFSQEVQFLPLEGDRIAVQSVADGALITTVEAGTDGLLRGALRGLNMSRSQSDFDLAAPFILQRFEEDGVYLADPLTDRSIRLESFGPIETGATADLLRLGHSGAN